MFHYFHDNQEYKKVQGSISSEELLLVLRSSKFNVLSPSEWLGLYLEGKLKTNDVFLSFDDGLKEQIIIALPILDQFNIKALFNIYTEPIISNKISNIEFYRYVRNHAFNNTDDFYKYFFKIIKLNYGIDVKKIHIDNYLSNYTFYSHNDKLFRFVRDVLLLDEYHDIMQKIAKEKNVIIENLVDTIYMNQDDIKKLNSSGHFIGLHSHNHSTVMDVMDYEQSLNDYTFNKSILEKIIMKQITIAAYPLGKYNEYTINALKKIDIQFGFESKKTDNSSSFKLSRVDIADIMGEL
jgi:peptidoglycan/xylan/chitin deacetylase (PgdA/CDA1 family)